VPRIRRSELPDGIFQITTRGVFRRLVYLDDADRLAFLALLALVVRRYRWECHAFCLMGNNYTRSNSTVTRLTVPTQCPNVSEATSATSSRTRSS
jgi:hypothetical protein